MSNNKLFSNPTQLILKKNEKNHNFDFSALITEEKLRFFLNDLCTEIKYPTTIIEFNKIDGYTQKRLDSELTGISLRPSCDLFRKCASPNYCKECDSNYASLFSGLEKADLPHKMEERIAAKQYENDKYSKYNKNIPCIKKEKNADKYYIEYDCPMLGYRELVFPIMYEDIILGALNVGQIKLINRTAMIAKQKENFFREYPDIFNEYINKTIYQYNNKITRENYKKEIQRFIIEKGNRTFSTDIFPSYYPVEKGIFNFLDRDMLDEAEYETLIKKICLSLQQLEEKIVYESIIIKDQYIRNTVDNMIEKFEEETGRIIEAKEIDIDNLWGNVKDKMNSLVNSFDLRYILVYGPGTFENNLEFDNNKLKLVATAYAINDEKHNDKDHYYSLDKLPDECFAKPISSMVNEKLFDGLEDTQKNNLEDKLILLFPVSYNKKLSNVVVIKYQDSKNKNLDAIKKTKENLGRSMLWFTAIIFSNLLAVTENIIQNRIMLQNEYTEKMLRMYRHEISHLTLALRHINKKYIGDYKKIKSLNEEKLRSVYQDIESLLNLFNYLSGNTQIFTKQYNYRQSYICVFRDLIYKWEQIYKLEIEGKSTHFTYFCPDTSLEIKTDKFLLEQIIYNLINNAIKYSHWGTNIEIEFKRDAEYNSVYILSVTDYGIGIEYDENVYKLFYRSPNVEYLDHLEGSGIGLYVAKQAALSMSGSDIKHKCEKVSDFNVPLLQIYLDTGLEDYSEDGVKIKKEEVIAEIERLKKEKIYEDIISEETDMSQLTEFQIIQTLKTPTYRVRFEVIL